MYLSRLKSIYADKVWMIWRWMSYCCIFFCLPSQKFCVHVGLQNDMIIFKVKHAKNHLNRDRVVTPESYQGWIQVLKKLICPRAACYGKCQFCVVSIYVATSTILNDESGLWTYYHIKTSIKLQTKNAELKYIPVTLATMNPMSSTVFLISSSFTSALSYSTVPCLSSSDTVTFTTPFISPTVDSIRLTQEWHVIPSIPRVQSFTDLPSFSGSPINGMICT